MLKESRRFLLIEHRQLLDGTVFSDIQPGLFLYEGIIAALGGLPEVVAAVKARVVNDCEDLC